MTFPESVIGWDTETHLIRRGRQVPPLVCLSAHGSGEPPAWALPGREVDVAPGEWCRVLHHTDVDASVVEALLGGPSVAHNAPFDLAVLAEHVHVAHGSSRGIEAVVDALAEGRARCTQVRERLIRLALGELEFSVVRSGLRPTSYSLAGLVDRYFAVDISAEKADPRAWRLRYAELADVPVEHWPIEALEYAGLDAWWASRVYAAQPTQAPASVGGYPLWDAHGVTAEARETAAAFALWTQACRGLRTDPEAVEGAIASWEAIVEDKRTHARAVGWVRPDGSTARKALQTAIVAGYAARGETPPRTKPSKTYPDGQVQYSEEVLRESGDADLATYADSLAAAGYLSRWSGALREGARGPLTYGVTSLLETGRASVYDPPLQQPPREGETRSCFVPRPGYVFCSADYAAVELCSLAQICLWLGLGDTLAGLLRAGRDPHVHTGAALLTARGIPHTYDTALAAYRAADPAVVEARQHAKAPNFGLPGGMGPVGLRAYARGLGIELTLEACEDIHHVWFQTYPEVRGYLGWVESTVGDGGVVRQFVSGRIRSGVRLTAAWNGYFQALTADGAKHAVWLLCAAAYTGRCPRYPELDEAARVYHGAGGRGARRGPSARPVLFLHDEVLAELPEETAPEMADAQAAIMKRAMERHMPDIPITVEPALMARWYKGAKTIRDADGRLAVWRPKAGP